MSVLNDVIGPVMRGPSSSHTAGAYRIARLACGLAGGRPKDVVATFDPDGSYAATYKPLGVDAAFAAGCLGWEMTDARYGEAVRAAGRAGLQIRFAVEPLEHADHPNAMLVRMDGAPGGTLEIMAKSVGGGIVEVGRLDGRRVAIDGRCWTIVAECRRARSKKVRAAIERLAQGRTTAADSRAGGAVQADFDSPPAADLARRVSEIPGVTAVRTVAPVLYPQPGRSGIGSAAALLALAERDRLSLGAAARRAESRLLGLAESTLTAEMSARYAVMRAAVAAGLEDRDVDMPLTGPSASRIMRTERRGGLLLGGLLTRAAARAMAAMHTSNSKGIVCAAPTGGSAGVLAGVLVTLETDKNVELPVLARALFAAGGVGQVIAARATFAAETAGCQVEIGAAGAMAAAAVVEVAGGTARQAIDAAAVALQNTMGSVCDPVGGGCEIPCHTRNAAAAVNAFVCADLVMGGYENPVPLDDTVDASFAVGRALPRELRCTALGGLAITPSALALVKAKERRRR
ncbi:MAG TPA: L-serine ammonia-lyase, iron-sulfur-dependent, subunit alpha [Terriglobales bacterium]|nr:L-serine ammonia-lyase, iron-sulfur-dependent, subunit alpha [Terriglobales bacterium]